MRLAAPVLLAVLLAACQTTGGQGDRGSTVLLATTTSFQDSGLLDVLKADFEKRTGYRLRPTAVGTGAALAIGARGDADVLFVHAPEEERRFMAAGNGEQRLLVMHNDFVIVGPPSDPAKIRGRDAATAFRAISAARATFISRGDNSGTNIFELGLWRRSAVDPDGAWYVRAAIGMGQTLQVASEKGAYTLTDRGTYLARRSQLALALLVEGGPEMLNLYHVITVASGKFPRVNTAGGRAFASYLVSVEAQRLIGTFGIDTHGEPLFTPDAGKDEAELR